MGWAGNYIFNKLRADGNYAILIFIPFLFMSANAFADVPPIFESSNSFTVVPSAAPTTTLTIPDVVIGTQLDRLLIVGVAIDHQATNKPTVTSITFGPTGSSCSENQSFTQVGSSVSTVANVVRNEIWQLTAPTVSQTCDIIVTFSDTVGDNGFPDRTPASALSVYFSNVDQSNPIESSLTNTNTGNSNTPSVSISSTSGQHVFDTMSSSSNSGIAPTPGPNQSPRLTYATSGFTNFLVGASTQLGGADSAMSWSFTNADDWAISAIAIQSAPGSGGGNGCDTECTEPTLGVDNHGKRFVNDGFRLNNYVTDVNHYYTPFPLTTVNVGEENVAELKIYENSGVSSLSHVGIGFGLDENSSFSESAVRIEIDFNSDGIETVSVFDPLNLLDNVRVERDLTNCMDTDQIKCNLVRIYHTFNAPFEFDIIITDIWDAKRNARQNNFNHGIKVAGESQNPSNTMMVAFGEKNMRGLYELTQIEPVKDIWADEFGSIYLYKGNHRFERISQHADEQLFDYVTSHGCDRNCNWFNEYKKGQQLLAEKKLSEILQFKTIAGELPDSFYHPIKLVSRSDDIDLQNSIKNEIKEAHEFYERFYLKYEKPVNNFGDQND